MPPVRRMAITRACDWCRQRKVKCDGSEVCANCRISQLPCQYTTAPKKRGPKVPPKSRGILESEKCEQKVGTPWFPSGQEPANSALPELHGPVSGTYSMQLTPRCETDTPHHRPARLSDLSPDPVAATTLVHAVRDNLLRSMDAALQTVSVLEAVNRCIDLYMQYVFPTAPIVHEPTLRASAAQFFSCAYTGSTDLFGGPTHHEEVAHMRKFALITALCASVASVIPDTLLSYRKRIASPCLSASRNVLKAFEDYDVEQPNSFSIATRVLHTIALQHITGKAVLSNYVLGQAAYLARDMRLYSEEALKAHEPLEAKLLRNLFWHMYAADQAAACLESRPILLHNLIFSEEMTVSYDSSSAETGISLINTAGSLWFDNTFEDRLLLGFHLPPRLWTKAATLILDMKAHKRGHNNQQVSNNDAHDDNTKTRMTQAYLEFLSIMGSLPDWLHVPQIITSQQDSEAVQFHKTAFWVQRCTILVVFQCLRLVILQQSIVNEVGDIMGLCLGLNTGSHDHNEDLSLPMAKISLIHDIIQTLDDIPFVYLKVKGEPTVERIRWVGSVLLEILDKSTNEMIVVRAEHYFKRLLDLLAGLDSKSSDVLSELKEQSQTKVRHMFT